jgi:glyoxylase-like metal-dependent hydrolase (beta-lactamase superfamily II)
VDDLAPWAEGVWVLPLRTPTLPPATSTNTAVVAGEQIVVMEPATPHPDQQRQLDDLLARLVAEGRSLAAILITHHHHDHIGYVEPLRQRHGIPVLAHALTASRVPFVVNRHLSDGETLDLGAGVRLQVMHTPGHAPGHVVVHELRSGVVHGGDMVAGEGTILIDPEDDGDMTAYLASLRRMQTLGASALIPAHGPVLRDVDGVLQRYVAHRLAREAKVLAAIGSSSARDDVLAVAYADTPRVLWPLALRSLQAHLNKLVRDGRIEQAGDRVARI